MFQYVPDTDRPITTITARFMSALTKRNTGVPTNMHRDGSVHLEVFDKNTGKFKGTCRIDDIAKFMAKKENRVIDLRRHP